MRYDLAAARPRARPQIKNVIRGADRFFIMLDHDHRISEIAEPAERRQQPGIVALMQSDAWFIEHIENSGQPGADLGGQPDPLCFTAGKRPTLPIERKIIQSDFDQELESRIDLPHDIGHDLALLFR